MDHSSETLALVREAGIGNRECMEKLLEVTRPRLFGYLMRLTMDYHLTEDILQEVQSEILTSLWRLNKTSRFWPWIYKYAWGKVKHHYRDTRKHDTIFLSNIEKDYIDEQYNTLQLEDGPFGDEEEAEQLFETIYNAMKKVGLKPRNVLTMRCFEEMSFHEIGEFLECSETNARVMFFRAKRKLKKQLRKKGYKPNQSLLPAIGLFGALTSKTLSAGKTVAAVTSSSAEVGFLPSVIGFLTSKSGLVLSGVCSFFAAWFTLANLGTIMVVTVLLSPLILIMMLSFAYSNR